MIRRPGAEGGGGGVHTCARSENRTATVYVQVATDTTSTAIPPGRPAYANLTASASLNGVYNRPQPLQQPPPTACLTASGTKVLLLPPHSNAGGPAAFQRRRCRLPKAVLRHSSASLTTGAGHSTCFRCVVGIDRALP